MALTKEQYQELPEFVKSDYEPFGDGYRPKAEGKAEALKASLNDLDGKSKGFESQLSELRNQQEQAIRQARDEALKEALSKGQKDEAIKRFEEQMEDLRQRAESDKELLAKERDEAYGLLKAGKKEAFMANLYASLGIFEECREDFQDLVGNLVDFDPKTGKPTFFERGGGATSLDEKAFIEQLKSRPAVQRLMKAEPTAEGGHARGNNGSGGGASKRFNEYTGAELTQILKTDPSLYQRLKNEFYGKEE